MLALSKDLADMRQWQHVLELIRDKVTGKAIADQITLALMYDGQMGFKYVSLWGAPMDEGEFEKGRQELMRSTLDLETKAINYLLVANGAGLAGCLATLKDYATVPQLHGVGALIVIFSAGLVSGMLAFLTFESANFEIMKQVLIKDGEPPTRATVTMSITNLLMQISGGCFILAIIIVASKLVSL
jgi:hypothetical protein